MKFMVNRAVADIGALKKELASHRIDEMEDEVKKIKVLNFDLESIKLKIDYMASKEEIGNIRIALNDYVPLKHFNELAGDFAKLSKVLVKHDQI
jgi:hypothetical protein